MAITAFVIAAIIGLLIAGCAICVGILAAADAEGRGGSILLASLGVALLGVIMFLSAVGMVIWRWAT